MNQLHRMLCDPLDKLAAFTPPANYTALARNSFSPEAKALAAELKAVARAALAVANRSAAMLRDLEGQFNDTARATLSEENAIVFEEGFTSDLGLEVAIYDAEEREAGRVFLVSQPQQLGEA